MSHINDPCDAVAKEHYADGSQTKFLIGFDYLDTELEVVHVALYDPIERQYEDIENWSEASSKSSRYFLF